MLRRGWLCLLVGCWSWIAWVGAAQAQISDAELTSRVERALKAALGDAKVKVLGPRSLQVEMAGGQGKLSLDNLAVNCANNPPGCEELIRRVVGSVVEQQTVRKTVPADLRVVLRDDTYVRQFAQMAAGSPKPEDNRIVSRPFLAGAHLVYVIDTPNSIRALNQAGLKELGLSAEQLHATALKNLAESLPAIQFRRFTETQVYLVSGDDYASSQVLLAERWPAVAEKFGNRLLMAMPNRNLVFLADGGKPAGVRALRGIAAEAAGKYPYPISTALFEWSPAGWKLFRE